MIFEPLIKTMEQDQRQRNLAHETEIRRLNSSLQQLQDGKTETADEQDQKRNEKIETIDKNEEFPPEAIHDAWKPAAEQLRKDRESNRQSETLVIKIYTPDKGEEEYLQIQLKCKAHDIKYNGKGMLKEQVMVRGRLIHDYNIRCQILLGSLQIMNGFTAMINGEISNLVINKEAVRGNEQVQGYNELQNINKVNYDSPDNNGSSGRRGKEDEIFVVMQLGPGGHGGPPNGDDGPGSPGDPNFHNCNNIGTGGNRGEDRRGREFQFVNLRNVNIVQFTGKQFNINPYMPFNNGLRNLIMTQCQDGEELLEILRHVESYGGDKFINKYLNNLAKQRLKAYEFGRVIMAALMNANIYACMN